MPPDMRVLCLMDMALPDEVQAIVAPSGRSGGVINGRGWVPSAAPSLTNA
jgi:hypothetical protein